MSGRVSEALYPEGARLFQSPDGDSLCPDVLVLFLISPLRSSFSPLTGILYVRTIRQNEYQPGQVICFSPLTGILYVRTQVSNPSRSRAATSFQSPDGDSLCPDSQNNGIWTTRALVSVP